MLLDVISGPDMFSNPTSVAFTRPNSYLDEINLGVNKIKAGVIKEGFLYEDENTKNVSEIVLKTIDKLKNQGMQLEEISIPELIEAKSLYYLLSMLEIAHVFENNGQPYAGRQATMIDLKRAFKDLKVDANLPQNTQIAMIASKLFAERISTENIFEKAMNRSKVLSE